jgi:hypothetical protein
MSPFDLLTHLDNPRQLEKLYRTNKTAFKSAFNALYPELADQKLAQYWYERLNYETSAISWGSRTELWLIILASLVAGSIAKLPAWLTINSDFFYSRDIGFIVFPLLITYFSWRNKLSLPKIASVVLTTLAAGPFINLLPANDKSNTLLLSCLHLPLFLWAILGFAYCGNNLRDYRKRLDFLRYNGDLAIMTTLILLAGMLLTGITIGLFSVTGFQIDSFYFNYVVVFGLAASPIVGTYIVQTNPQLVNRVSPVIAKIFTPLVLLTLVVYLVAVLFSGKNLYRDRDFLITFNLLLLGVMALILFSIAENFQKSDNRTGSTMLLALSGLTVLVNGLALSAILFRISAWGFTPNRLAVLGGNLLILANLLLVTFRLFKHVTKQAAIREVENSIALFLPFYSVWTVIVAFLFPLLFRFK